MGKNNKSYKIEDIREHFKEKDYTLVSSEYKNKETKLDFICNKHKELGIQQVSYQSFVQNNNNCKQCRTISNKQNWYQLRNFHSITQEEFKKKHLEEYKQQLFDAVGDEYILIDIYKADNGMSRLVLKHSACGCIYDVERYHFFKRKNRCQNTECVYTRKHKTGLKSDTEVKQKVRDITDGEYELLGRYHGTNEKHWFKHLTCGRTFCKTPHNFFAGQRCLCTLKPSTGEEEIMNVLSNLGIEYEFQKTYDDLVGKAGMPLSYDFYLPEYNLLIEYQGEFHDGKALGDIQDKEERIKKQQWSDKTKAKYAEDNNIPLLEIWYWDFDFIEDILKEVLFETTI